MSIQENENETINESNNISNIQIINEKENIKNELSIQNEEIQLDNKIETILQKIDTNEQNSTNLNLNSNSENIIISPELLSPNDLNEERNKESEVNISNQNIKKLEQENQLLKNKINNFNNNKSLETKYKELLLDYENLQAISNQNIIHNEELIKKNEELKKENSHYKNKYNLILKEQKKTKNLLDEMSGKYSMAISFKNEVEKQKIKVKEIFSENEKLNNKIENEYKNYFEEINELKNKIFKLEGEKSNLENHISKYQKDEEELKAQIKNFEDLENKYNSVNNTYSLL